MPDTKIINTLAVIEEQEITGPITVSAASPPPFQGANVTYLFTQDDTGNHDISFDPEFVFPGSITLPFNDNAGETRAAKFVYANGLYIYEVDNVVTLPAPSLPSGFANYYAFNGDGTGDPVNYFPDFTVFSYGTIGISAQGVVSGTGIGQTLTKNSGPTVIQDTDSTIAIWFEGRINIRRGYERDTPGVDRNGRSSLDVGINSITHYSYQYSYSSSYSSGNYSSNSISSTSTNVGDGTIHHLVFTKEKTGPGVGTKTLWLDGVILNRSSGVVLTPDVIDTDMELVTLNATINGVSGGGFDNLVLYDRALSDAEVQDVFNFEKSNYLP